MWMEFHLWRSQTFSVTSLSRNRICCEYFSLEQLFTKEMVPKHYWQCVVWIMPSMIKGMVMLVFSVCLSTSLAETQIFQLLLDGLQWNFVETFTVPRMRMNLTDFDDPLTFPLPSPWGLRFCFLVNASTAIGWIAMKCGAHIQIPHWMNSVLTFTLAPSSGQNVNLSSTLV